MTRCRDPNRRTGLLGEEHAASHMRRLGFELLGRNVRTRHGEIDLIAFDGEVLAFVEVKSARCAPGRTEPTVAPLQRLDARKRSRLRRLAGAWLNDPDVARPWAPTIRFDAVAVLLDAGGALLRLDHLEGAW